MSERINEKRIESLCNFVYSVGGKIEGRKKLQKLIYIAGETKQFPYKYDFNWNMYGVYSYDLAADLEYSKIVGLIDEKDEPKFNYISHVYEIADEAKKNIDASGLQDAFVKELNEKDVSLLEVLSSIIFFYRSIGDMDEVKKYLKLQKGHLEHLFDDGFAEFEKLKDKLN